MLVPAQRLENLKESQMRRASAGSATKYATKETI
jgi:hypothetical protein